MSESADITRYGPQILQEITTRGWNAYKSTDVGSIGQDEVLRRGPAAILECEERYVMMPQAEDPTNPNQVMAALERLALRLNRETPTIEIDGQRFPWTGFKPRESDVKVITDIGHHISYEGFIQCLRTIVHA